MAEITLTCKNSFSELPALSEGATGFLEANGASAPAVFAANLAIEELVTNIVKYGYDDAGEHCIAVRLSISDGILELQIEDDGHAFNPFDQPVPDTSLAAEERDIGGLGIHFIRNMLDSYAHERRDGRNVVTVTKKL